MARDYRLIQRRGRNSTAPASGVAESQGNPYPYQPEVREAFRVPMDEGVQIKGWINPFQQKQYAFLAPDSTAGQSSIRALGANFKRTYLVIQNLGPGNLFLNWGAEASLDCFFLVATQAYEQIGGGGVFPDKNSPLASSHIARDAIYILSDQPLTRCTFMEGIWTSSGPQF